MNDIEKFIFKKQDRPGVLIGKFIDADGKIWRAGTYFDGPSITMHAQNSDETVTFAANSPMARGMTAYSIVKESENES